MRLEPVSDWVIARAIVVKSESQIVLVDPSFKPTRCYLLDEVSEKAEAAGYKKGDIVISHKVFDMKLSQRQHSVIFPINEIVIRVYDAPLSEFVDLGNKPIQVLEEVA